MGGRHDGETSMHEERGSRSSQTQQVRRAQELPDKNLESSLAVDSLVQD